jgi:hypothetical protein
MTTTKHSVDLELELEVSGTYMEADASVGMASGFEDIEINSAYIIVSENNFVRDKDGKLVVTKVRRRVNLTEGLDPKAHDQVMSNLLRGVDEPALNEALVDQDIGEADAASDYRYEQMRDDRDDRY